MDLLGSERLVGVFGEKRQKRFRVRRTTGTERLLGTVFETFDVDGLITVINAEPVESIRDLARRVDRDKGNVKRDLDVLVDENLVAFETDGRSKRPFIKPDTIV